MPQAENIAAAPSGAYDVFDRIFLEHPREGGERYGEHLLFTLKVAGFLLATSVCILIHGILPCFHQTTTSRRIFALGRMFRVRARKSAPLR